MLLLLPRAQLLSHELLLLLLLCSRPHQLRLLELLELLELLLSQKLMGLQLGLCVLTCGKGLLRCREAWCLSVPHGERLTNLRHREIGEQHLRLLMCRL
jgi:hypothetical protein